MCVLRLPIPFPDKHSTDVNWAIKKRISISRQSAHISGTGTRKKLLFIYYFQTMRRRGNKKRAAASDRIHERLGECAAIGNRTNKARSSGPAHVCRWASGRPRLGHFNVHRPLSSNLRHSTNSIFKHSQRAPEKMASKQAWAQTVEDKQTDRSFSLSRVGGEAKNHT